jgi:uncharacterized protein (DUF849 family)
MQTPGKAQPCIITAAITGSVPRKENNPAVPITVSEQIESTHAAFEAGAALVHVHVRNDDQSTTSNPDKFAEFQERIRKLCPDIIVQFSTGGRSGVGSERGCCTTVPTWRRSRPAPATFRRASTRTHPS